MSPVCFVTYVPGFYQPPQTSHPHLTSPIKREEQLDAFGVYYQPLVRGSFAPDTDCDTDPELLEALPWKLDIPCWILDIEKYQSSFY
jgi:hypothetical protein